MPSLCAYLSAQGALFKTDPATQPRTMPPSPHKTSTTPSSPRETSPAASCHVTNSTTDASIPALSHDASPSILHRLPLDLLYHLTRHHLNDAVDILALRTTSHAFRTPLIPASPTSTRTSRLFLKRLNRDLFTRACAAERRGEQPPHQQAYNNNEEHPCSACVKLHPPSHFSAAQLAAHVPPEQRRCRGANGVVRVCRHMALTYEEVVSEMAEARRLRRDRRMPPRTWCPPWQCRHRRHCMAEAAINERNSSRTTICWTRKAELFVTTAGALGAFAAGSFDPWARVRLVVAVGGGGVVRRGGECLTLERVWRVLAAVEESGVAFACRHVRLGDPRTFKTLPWNVGPDARADGSILISSHDCLNPGCEMTAHLYWNRRRLFTGDASNEAVVELEITRRLGLMRLPSSEQWLAQIEEA